ncbi:MAG: CDP-diacylglycerol--glycerol-3-phosphate 3-phosphatidyltransferase [Gemmatimonadota bacterium]|nr:CDP-diacylglycerol--glycerol-3-phosphate 3-phosphatidyltransferase [Gemmatimonadota bacterium]
MRHLPNSLTVLRILFCPVLFYMILESSSPGGYLLTYYIFLIAALTDIYDGILARRHKNITTFGKLVDPIADKLLLAASLIPFYMLSETIEPCRHVTLLILAILLGREILITGLRYYSMWRGKVFSASRLAKFKTAFQMFFIGSVLVHLFQRQMMLEYPKFSYPWFDNIHFWLNVAIILTVVTLSIASAGEYLIKNLPTLSNHSRA